MANDGIDAPAGVGILDAADPRARRRAAGLLASGLVAAGPTVDIGGDGRTLGLRVPDHADLRALLRTTGPLATTSANRSGSPTPPTVDGVAVVFGCSLAPHLGGGPAGPP